MPEFSRLGSLLITYQPKEKHFICWKPHISQMANDRKSVLAFAKWPASTPTGQALREWLDGILPDPTEPQPEIDPTQNTRTVI